MTHRVARALALTVVLGARTLAGQSSVSPEVLATVRSVYAYGKRAPVRVDTVSLDDRPGAVYQKLVFSPLLHPPFPALLAVPKGGTGRYPVVVLLHGLTSSKNEWLGSERAAGERLLGAGFAVLALDAPYHGERAGESRYRIPFDGIELRDLAIRWTIENRRALDYLATRADVDAARIGVLGYSMGAYVAIDLSGVDSRITVAVTAVPPVGGADNPEMRVVAHTTFLGSLRIPTLMLMGRKDQYYTEVEAQRAFEMIGDPRKELAFFDSGHILPEDWIAKSLAWLVKYLQ